MRRIIEVDQGSAEWHELRRGKFTATDAWNLLNNPRAAKVSYLERLLDKVSFAGNEATRYGQEAEELAADDYALKHGVTLHRAGFVVNDDFPLLGCSPDRLAHMYGGEGVLEIKCPYSKALPEEPDPKHLMQVIFQLGVCDLRFGHLLYWSPEGAVLFPVHSNPVLFQEMSEVAEQLMAEISAAGGPEQALQEARRSSRSGPEWVAAAQVYLEAKRAADAAQEALDEARKELLYLSDAQNCEGAGVRVTWGSRKGTVAWPKVLKKYGVPAEAAEEFRSPPTPYAKVEVAP